MILQSDTVMEENKMTSRTYRWDIDKKRIQGFTDGLKAMEQAIYKMLNTERYEYLIYSWNYGVELEELVGKDRVFIKADLKRRIEEALLQDDRITSIENFNTIEGTEKDMILVSFDVVTTEGNIKIEQEVRM